MSVDGFLAAVPEARLDDYLAIAKGAAAVWVEYGALSVVGSKADDVEMVSFQNAVKLKPDQGVFFSWATYRDRAHRDEVIAKVMVDPRMKAPVGPPFSGDRMLWGGFKTIVQQEAL